MVTNIIFIEQYSLDASEQIKLSNMAKKTGCELVWYKSGSTKPELVSVIKNDDQEAIDELVKRTKEQTTREILDSLSRYLNSHAEVYSGYDSVRSQNVVKTKYPGLPNDLIADFKEHLNRG